MTDDKLSRRLSKIVSALVRRGLPLNQARGEFEKQFILAALRKNKGNLGQSAQDLGVHRNTLRNKIVTHGIDPEAEKAALSKPRKPKKPS